MKYDFITLTQNEGSNLSEGPFSRLEQKKEEKRNEMHKEAFQEYSFNHFLPF